MHRDYRAGRDHRECIPEHAARFPSTARSSAHVPAPLWIRGRIPGVHDRHDVGKVARNG